MTEQSCSHPNPPSEIIQKLQLAFSHAEIILQTLNGRDYHGDNRGLNETGFKVAIISGLLQQGFVVASEVKVGNGYIDLLQYATSHPTLKFILELKYVRGGIIKSISDRIRAREFGNIYNPSARDAQDTDFLSVIQLYYCSTLSNTYQAGLSSRFGSEAGHFTHLKRLPRSNYCSDPWASFYRPYTKNKQQIFVLS